MFAAHYFPKSGGVTPPAELPYQGDTYLYDSAAGTGSINDGTPLDPETIYA